METYKLAILAARSFRSRPDYEDLLQETAIRIWQAEPKIDPSRPEHERQAYLRQAGKRAILDVLRGPGRDRDMPGDEEDIAAQLVETTTPEGIAIAKQRQMRILAAICIGESRLSPRQREIIYDRLGLAPMSGSLRRAHKGTRLVHAHAARNKFEMAFAETGADTTREQIIQLLS